MTAEQYWASLDALASSKGADRLLEAVEQLRDHPELPLLISCRRANGRIQHLFTSFDVHLTADPYTAVKVGRRHGGPALFTVDATLMAGDGLLFYRSENGVWLTDAVPPQYLKRTIDHT